MAQSIIFLFNELDSLSETHHVDIKGQSIADEVMAIWPGGFPDQTVLVISPEREVLGAESLCDRKFVEGEAWTVVIRPQGFLFLPAVLPIFGGIALGTTWAGAILMAVSFLSSFFLKPDLPEISGNYEWTDDSPQFFSAQSNRMRPGARVPDVLGTMRIWPDLIAEPWVRFNGKDQQLSELYVVTNGKATISDSKLYDEQVISLPPPSGITTYQPGEAWPVDFPIYKSNAFVGSVELPGPNESITFGVSVIIDADASAFVVEVDGFFDGFGVDSFFLTQGNIAAGNVNFYKVTAISGDGRTLSVSPSPAVNQTIDDGSFEFIQCSEVSVDVNGDAIIYQSTFTPVLSGTSGGILPYVSVAYFTDNPGFGSGSLFVTTTGDIYSGGWAAELNYSLDYNDSPVDTYYDKFFTRDSKGAPGIGTPDTFNYAQFTDSGYNPNNPGTGYTTQTFGIPGTTTDCEFDVEFAGGLYAQSSGGTPVTRTVDIEFYFREVGTETWNLKTFSFSGVTRTVLRYTTKVVWANEGLPTGEYECYFRRVTDWIPDTSNTVVVDAVQLINLRGRQDTTELETDILNCTLVRLDLTTQNAQQITQQRSFNVVAQRWLPNWATGDGQTLVQSNTIRQAILYTLMDSGQYDINDIDREELNAIHDELAALGGRRHRFDGILDQSLTVEDQVLMIAKVGRINIYRRASNIHFNRLTAGQMPTTLINSRNKIAPEIKTMNFSLQNEPDGVIIRFMDSNDGWAESSVQYPTGTTLINPSEQSIIGVTWPAAAQAQAQYLWDSRINERDTIEVNVTEDGVLLSPGQIVAITDHLRYSPPIDGEVVRIVDSNAGQVELDQPIPKGTYICRIRDRQGSLYSTSTNTIDVDGQMTVTIPEWSGIVGPSDETYQVGLLYSFTEVDDSDGELYYVTGATPSRDGPVKLALRKYSDAAYAVDAAATQAPVRRTIKKVRVPV